MSEALSALAVNPALDPLCPSSTSEKGAGGGKMRPKKSVAYTRRRKKFNALADGEF